MLTGPDRSQSRQVRRAERPRFGVVSSFCGGLFIGMNFYNSAPLQITSLPRIGGEVAA